GLVQALAKRSGELRAAFRRAEIQEPDHRCRLLRARCERPRRRRAAEQRDELAPLQLIELHRLLREPAGLRDIGLGDGLGEAKGLFQNNRLMVKPVRPLQWVKSDRGY